MNIKRIQTAYLFPNGNLAVCDKDGNQIPELQGEYCMEKHKRILLESLNTCQFEGFTALPNGFNFSIMKWYEYFKDKNLSWEEINNLL